MNLVSTTDQHTITALLININNYIEPDVLVYVSLGKHVNANIDEHSEYFNKQSQD